MIADSLKADPSNESPKKDKAKKPTSKVPEKAIVVENKKENDRDEEKPAEVKRGK